MSTHTKSISAWEKTFNERVSAFAEAIKVDEKVVREKLASFGADGKDEQSLTIIDSEEFLPIRELFEAFSDAGLTSRGSLRIGVKQLRGSGWSPETSSEPNLATAFNRFVESHRPKSDLSDDELISRYTEDDTEVAEILRKRTHGRPCIVFNVDGSVNNDLSLKLIRIAKKQTTPAQYVADSGIAYRVLRAGTFPVKPVDESPVCPGVSLIDGYCPDSETNWTGIPLDCRILARLYILSQMGGRLTNREMKHLAKDAALGVDLFRKEYPSVALRYDELRETGKLPDLKISPNAESETGKVDTAF